MSQPTLFINQFQKGASENSNIGTGTLLGIETYNKKGVAQLTKDTIATTASGFTWQSIPKYIASNGGGEYYAIALNPSSCEVYYSADGITWFDTGESISGKGANGLIYYEGYYFLFASDTVYYFPTGGGSTPNPVLFKTGLVNNVEHPSFVPIFDNSIYFGNANLVGKIGYGTNTVFNPAGTSGVDYFFNSGELSTLPTYYIVTALSFLSPNYVAIGTASNSNSSVADILLWNPFGAPVVETPLRLYSRGATEGGGLGGDDHPLNNGITQLINRNNILYATTAGNHALYETNGSSFSLITDTALRSNIRKTTGSESTLPVFLTGFAPAIAVIGNKLLTGFTIPNSGDVTPPTGYGVFPCGIWTISFSDSAAVGEVAYGLSGTAIQCEFTISTNTIVATTNIFKIGFIYPIAGNAALISWADNSTFGIDYISTTNFQNNINVVMIESEMMEIGTPLNPSTVGNIQINLVRNLLAGQTISVYYRTAFDQDFQLVTGGSFNGTFTGDGTTNYYSIIQNQIKPTRYIQFQVHLATNNANITSTPQLRNFIVGNPSSQ